MPNITPRIAMPGCGPTILDSTHEAVANIDAPETTFEQAAMYFARQYGFALALFDATREGNHSVPIAQAFVRIRGHAVRTKNVMTSTIVVRTFRALNRARHAQMRMLLDIAELPGRRERAGRLIEELVDYMPREMKALAAEQDLDAAAQLFGVTWLSLRALRKTCEEVRDRKSIAFDERLTKRLDAWATPTDRAAFDSVARSAARWTLDLEAAWMERCFDAYLGEPTIKEILSLYTPSLRDDADSDVGA